MDINATLAELRIMASELTGRADVIGDNDVLSMSSEMMSLWQTMDEWLSRGGFLPEAWQASRR